MSANHKVELLAPAGNFEKLEIAIHYGADAVYLGGKNFSLRNFSGNFDNIELKEAVKYAHKRNVKVYAACNVYPRGHEAAPLRDHLKRLAAIFPDAIIVADPGVLAMAKATAPHLNIHLSTQANTTNAECARFWANLGVKRVNLARELSLTEIAEIAKKVAIETEAFVHGAMCISYSGRCLLSSFMAMRDSNRGMCCHPCRWKYAVMEESRPGQYFPVAEDNRGAYIFNSKDLCMIEHIPEMIKAGVDSLKIEGRMKGVHYLAGTVKAYREAIDSYYENPDGFEADPRWLKELKKTGLRGYSTGFYFGDPGETTPNYELDKFANQQSFVGKIIQGCTGGKGLVAVRNKVYLGERVELLPVKGPARLDSISKIIDAEGIEKDYAQPGTEVTIVFSGNCFSNEIVRKIQPES